MVLSTLATIRTKVRRLTARPSTNQITDAQIDEYVNTFYLYDMPETLRLFSLHSTFEFMTTQNVDQYDMRTMPITVDGITYMAADYYYNISPPAYIAGYQSFYSQDREQFFRTYPQLAEINITIQGDGTTGAYNFTLSNFPILQFQVTLGVIDDTGATLNYVDFPQTRLSGNFSLINSGDGTPTPIPGTINYTTGVGTITFPNNIPTTETITITAVPYQPNRPQAILFYENVLTLRPVPDREYLVKLDAYRLPTELIASGNDPELRQWWQYLAYGTSKKILEDSGDSEGLAQIMPGLKEQERLVLRRTIVQQTNERTSTIYTEMTSFPYGNFQGRF